MEQMAPWSGAPLTLADNQSVQMRSTPNGALIVTALNETAQNDGGALALTPGGSPPQVLAVPALSNAPSVEAANWQGRSLGVANVSVVPGTQIRIQAFAPGVPGAPPQPLLPGRALQLGTLQTAQGDTESEFMEVALRAPSNMMALVGIIGGAAAASYLIALNDPAGDTGVPSGQTGPPVAAGYYATAGGNAYRFAFDWGVGSIYLVNLSSYNAPPLEVALVELGL